VFHYFYREFDASNGITTAINLDNSAFLFNTHNFQTGQKLIYTPELQEPIAIAVTTIGSGAILKPVFDANNYSILRIKVLDGGSGYDPINLPKIEITGTQNPLSIGTFIPSIEPITGIITSIQIGTGNSGIWIFSNIFWNYWNSNNFGNRRKKRYYTRSWWWDRKCNI
jgi:hypothetical protein